MSRRDEPEPTLLDVQNAQRQVRERTVAAETIVAEFPRQMRRIAKGEGARQGRIWGVITLVIALLVSFLAGGLAVNTKLSTAQQLAVIQSADQRRQQQVDDALGKLAEANKELESRGQQPVTAPQDPSESDAVTAAITARVIASLPTTPTAQQVAEAIVPAVTANVLGPSQQTLAGLVANYFVRNPPQPGPPPSEAAIRAAVDASLAANPPAGGPKGDKGDPCLSSDPACVGKQGDQGIQGVAGPAGRGIVTGPAPVRTDDGSCVWRTTYTDNTSEDHPASPLACPLGN